jgi:serine kinase of HPr protein (carbohydrate metabolism regulator)
MRKVLSIGKHHIGINWDSDEFTTEIEYMFLPWQSSSVRADLEINIEKNSSGCSITIPGKCSSIFETGMFVSVLEQAITNTAIDILGDHLLIHSAVIDHEGTGVMIAGDHGTGKSTLALASLSHGWKILSDEVAIIGDRIAVKGFPRPLRILPDIVSMYPSIIPGECPVSVSSDGIAHVHYYCGNGYYKAESVLEYLLFPVYGKGETGIRQIGQSEAMERFLKQGFNFYLHEDRLLRELTGFIKQLTCYEMNYQHSSKAIENLANIKG